MGSISAKPVVLLAFAVLGLSACNLNFREEKDGGRDSLNECAPKGSISYAQIQNDVVRPANCMKCHAAGSSKGDFSTYPLLRASLPKIRERVLVLQDMPPSGPVTAGQANLLAQWIDNCAPENAIDPEPFPSPTASPNPSPSPSTSGRPLVRWAEVRAGAIHRCVECHDWSRTAATLRPKALKALDRAVVRSNMPVVSLDDETPVPLSREEKDVLVHWVVDGMLD